jgi:hypothetical protein
MARARMGEKRSLSMSSMRDALTLGVSVVNRVLSFVNRLRRLQISAAASGDIGNHPIHRELGAAPQPATEA